MLLGLKALIKDENTPRLLIAVGFAIPRQLTADENFGS